MQIPILDTNAEEMAGRVRSLTCQLGALRAVLEQAAGTALDGFAGPERDAFAARSDEIRRALIELEASLDGVPAQLERVGAEVEHIRRDVAARALGPGAVVANEVAQWLGW